MLSFDVDARLTRHLMALYSRFGEQYALLQSLSAAQKDAMHRYAKISMIGSSTRIENAILTDSEVGWLDQILGEDAKKTAFEANQSKLKNKFSKDKERSLEEVAGCRTMLQLIYDQTQSNLPLTENLIRALHAELMRHDSRSGLVKGGYKTHSNKVVEKNHETNQERVVFSTADPGVMTQTSMGDLVDWYNLASKHEPWSIAVTCELVFRFLAIHPFQDGNGRLGRGLFLFGLLQCADQSIANTASYLAIDRQIERHKEEYYLVLNQCSDGQFMVDSEEYKIQFFLHFMIKVLNEALADIGFYLKKHKAYMTLSDSATRVLECFKEKPELKLTTQQLCTLTAIPRRTVINALNQLMVDQFIQKHGKGAGTRYQLIF